MMADYVARKGTSVQLTEILDAANKRITDLPTIPEFIQNGRPLVCWSYVLGRCTFHNFSFLCGHVPKENIPDAFVDKVINMLTLGVTHCIRGEGGSPRKKVRFDSP